MNHFIKKICVRTGLPAAGIMLLLWSCYSKPKEMPHKKTDYIKKIDGKSDSIPVAVAQRGEVLIAYSDCKDCHAIGQRAKGPAFVQIAERYPVNKTFIKALANRIITGGSGSWGRSVMAPHPNLSPEDAAIMVQYILSLKKR